MLLTWGKFSSVVAEPGCYILNPCGTVLSKLSTKQQVIAATPLQYEIKDRDELQGNFGFSFAVPIVKYEDGLSQSQLPMILDVLGEKVGLHGKSPAEKIAVKQLLLDLEDIMAENFAKPCKWTEENGRQDKWFSLLEKRTSPFQFPLPQPFLPITRGRKRKYLMTQTLTCSLHFFVSQASTQTNSWLAPAQQ